MDFTHFDEQGNAIMVDVSDKDITRRMAIAEGTITVSPECFAKIEVGDMKKGDVLGVARIAGIMGAKKTAELIPLCHILNLTKVTVDFEKDRENSRIRAVCTAIDRGMEISGIHLVHKEGGASGVFDRTIQEEQA